MDVAVTDLSGCKKSLSIVIPADIAEGEFNRRTKELAKQARLPGFRPGKAPPSIIKQRFQKEIKNEVVHELIEERLDDLIKDRGLVPISKPVVDKLEFELGSPLTLQISFEVWPEVNLTDYKDLTIQVKKSPEITDEEVTKVLEQHREEAASYVPVEERPIQTGDLVGIHMEAMHQVRDNWVKLHEQDTTFTVGDSRLHAAFNENLLGLKPGDAKEFTIEYNNLYADKRLAGKTVRHTVRILDVKAKQLPEINDDLAKDAGHETLDQLKESIRAKLREQIQRDLEEEAKMRLVDQVIEQHPFDVPDVLVQNRVQSILLDLAGLLARQGIDVKHQEFNWKKIAEEQRPRAVQEVKRSVVLDQIAKKEYLEVLPAEVDMELARIAKASNHASVEAVRASYQQHNRLEDLKEELRFKKALDFMYRHAKLINDQGSNL